MTNAEPNIQDLPTDVVMHMSSDAYVRVLWAFAIALAKSAAKDQPALGEGLLRELRKLESMQPENPGAAVEVWMRLIEAHANELLDALGYQGDRMRPDA